MRCETVKFILVWIYRNNFCLKMYEWIQHPIDTDSFFSFWNKRQRVLPESLIRNIRYFLWILWWISLKAWPSHYFEVFLKTNLVLKPTPNIRSLPIEPKRHVSESLKGNWICLKTFKWKYNFFIWIQINFKSVYLKLH